MPSDSDSLADSQAWITWLETVPSDERDRVADLVAAIEGEGWNGMHKLYRQMFVEVLRGTISPIVANTLTDLVDRQMAALFLEHKEQGVLDAYPTSAAGSFMQLERLVAQVKPLQPRYIERHDDLGGDVLDSVMPKEPSVPKLGSS